MDFTDHQLTELATWAGSLPARERDELRERVAFFRSMLEITGCATVTDAIQKLKIWKGQIHGHADITSN